MTLWCLLVLAQPMLWGVTTDIKPDSIQAQFKALGTVEKGRWTHARGDGISIVRYVCRASDDCLSQPAEADFYFLGDTLSSVSLKFLRASKPSDRSPVDVIGAGLSHLGQPVASQTAVGRKIQYFYTLGQTLVAAQDGADAEVKIYHDRINPIGRAEAVAAGAKLDLKPFPGAQAYALGHAALLKGDWSQSESAFERVLATAKTSSFMRSQTKYILAMTIAAGVKVERDQGQVKSKLWRARASKKLERAASLAPSLKPHLTRLARTLSEGQEAP